MMPWISIAFRHDDTSLQKTLNAAEKTFDIYQKALDQGVENFLHGPSIKPVFRQYN